MSKHASALRSSHATAHVEIARRGPANICFPVYGLGDLEDWEAIEEWRTRPGESWATTQRKWDDIIGVSPDRRIPNDKFRYHWRRKCYCWPVELRLS